MFINYGMGGKHGGSTIFRPIGGNVLSLHSDFFSQKSHWNACYPIIKERSAIFLSSLY